MRSIGRALLWSAQVACLALVSAGAVHAHPGLDELQAAVDEAVAGEPDSPHRYLEQSHVYRLAGKWDLALEALRHAAEHGAAAATVESVRARIYLDAGWPRTAIFHIDRALALVGDGPAQGQLRVERGRAWTMLDEHAKAAADLGRGIGALQTPRPEHFFEWRDAHLAAGDVGAAIAALDAGVRRLGPVPSLELAAVSLEADSGLSAAALRRVDRLLAQNPGNPAWLSLRGDLLQRLDRDAEADEAYRQALALLQERPAPRRGERLVSLQNEIAAKLNHPGESEKGEPK